MFAIREYGWLFLIGFGVPVGGILGWLTGTLFKKLLHLDKSNATRDTFLGIAGFLIGSYTALIGFSLDEKWENGQLVWRRVGGFGDYLIPVSMTGAVVVVAIAYGFGYLARQLGRRL